MFVLLSFVWLLLTECAVWLICFVVIKMLMILVGYILILVGMLGCFALSLLRCILLLLGLLFLFCYFGVWLFCDCALLLAVYIMLAICLVGLFWFYCLMLIKLWLLWLIFALTYFVCLLVFVGVLAT